MKKNRQVKVLSIIALVLAIVGMSLGFAAFSSTLSISSSASVNPSSSDFKVVFSTSPTMYELDMSQIDIEGTSSGGATFDYNSVFVYNDLVSELNANFSAPNQNVIYTFYAHNAGEYDAYLRGISFTALDNGTYKKCSATTTDSTKATDSLVQAACDGIDVTISIDGTQYDLGSNISGHKLSKGGVEEIQVKIEYKLGSALADGPFKVEISDFKLNYSTVDGSNLISFTIDGTTYQAEEGMTWQEWYTSDYNTSPVYQEQNHLCSNDLTNVSIGNLDDFIIGGTSYPTGTVAPCK